ncbi:MAG: hypothetical protein BJ554DRAFT_8168, partial [Olpidium bornovanus]
VAGAEGRGENLLQLLDLLRRRPFPHAPEVRAELEAAHGPPVVADEDDRLFRTEHDVRQAGPAHHRLLAQRLVLVHVEVVHLTRARRPKKSPKTKIRLKKSSGAALAHGCPPPTSSHLPVDRHGGENRGRVRAPRHVRDAGVQVEAQGAFALLVVPEFHRPVSRRGQEHVRPVRVVPDAVDAHFVALIGRPGRLRAALVNLPFLRADYEEVRLALVEVDARAAGDVEQLFGVVFRPRERRCRRPTGAVRAGGRPDLRVRRGGRAGYADHAAEGVPVVAFVAEREVGVRRWTVFFRREKNWPRPRADGRNPATAHRVQELVLDERPLGHPPVPGDAEEVRVPVEVVRLPGDLPDRVSVLSGPAAAPEDRLAPLLAAGARAARGAGPAAGTAPAAGAGAAFLRAGAGARAGPRRAAASRRAAAPAAAPAARPSAARRRGGAARPGGARPRGHAEAVRRAALFRALPEVVHHHRAVIQARRQEGRHRRVEIDAHDARVRRVDEVRVGRVFERETSDQAGPLPREVVRPIRRREEVSLELVPAQARDLLLALLLERESPQREEGPGCPRAFLNQGVSHQDSSCAGG